MKKIILLITFFSSCNSLCRLNDGQKNILEKAKCEFSDYCEIEVIPCEFYYINIRLKQIENPQMTYNLHHALYDKSQKKGWLSLNVYDSEGNFILSQTIDGKRSTNTPNW